MKKSLTKNVLAVPYALFLTVFVVFPVMVILYFAFTNDRGQFSLAGFAGFFVNPRMLGTLVYSLGVSMVTTAVCLAVAWPTAYILAKGDFRHRGAVLLMFIMPMWINFTLRITAVKEILTFAEGNLAFHPFFNTILCMTYDFLPFMILPLYNAIAKIDDAYVEAARDLGVSSATVFRRVLLPLSVPGIVSGVTMVFLPVMTNYVVLDMIYNSTYIMGSLIGSYFNAYDWRSGSVVSIIMLAVLSVVTLAATRVSEGDEGEVVR